MHLRLTSLAWILGASLLSSAALGQPQPPPASPVAPPGPPPGAPAPPPAAQVAPAPLPPPPAQPPPSMEQPLPRREPPLEGVTAKGLPFSQRGGLIADFAALRIPSAQTPLAAIDIIARIPVSERTWGGACSDGVQPRRKDPRNAALVALRLLSAY